MTGYDASKHNRWLDPPDVDSIDECKVCQTRHDVGDMERLDGVYICRECQKEYSPLCDDCGQRYPLAQITLVKHPWHVYQFCPTCAKAEGYTKELPTKESENV